MIPTFLSSNDYDFLNNDPRLGDNIILLTYGGSYAYGTNVETSDIDVRGCTLNCKSDILGLTSLEQIIDNKTDTVIYSFNKFIRLLLNCNPNVIEILGCKPEHYFILSPIGQELLNNKKLFLSQKAAVTFGGYATQQLRRLENALAHDSKLNGRNKKKDDAHLNKYAMHLIRLYIMCYDILEKEEINTYRADEHNLLMDIRNGLYMKSDGTFASDFYEIKNHYEEKMHYALHNTSLPPEPNFERIQEFMMAVNTHVVNSK